MMRARCGRKWEVVGGQRLEVARLKCCLKTYKSQTVLVALDQAAVEALNGLDG